MNECISTSNKKICVLKQFGKSVRVLNPSEKKFDEALVDNCLIADHRERCDFFVRDTEYIWLIELKGSDVGKAVSQIIATIEHLPNEIGSRICIPVIVASRCPAIVSQQVHLRQFSKVKGKISSKIILQSRTATVTI